MDMVDFGLFGPGSMAWRLHREPALLVGGLRALMYQALHPLAIAAVADHSDYRSDVWGRYARTANYVVTTIFGTTRQAEALGARVREVHRPIRGVDRVTGRPYGADDPELLLWIHTTLVESFLAAYRRFVRPLDTADGDRYVAEMVRQAELVGLAAGDVPATEAANARFIERLRPELMVTRPALQAVDTVLHPPLPAWRRPLWWVAGQSALALMPDHAMALLGRRRGRAAEVAAALMVRHGAAHGARLLQSRAPAVVIQAVERTQAAGLRF
jgi:uncharacterized protein (DUF2236 family)